MTVTRVFVAALSPVTRAGLRAMLATGPEVEVVGEAHALAAGLDPQLSVADVVLMAEGLLEEEAALSLSEDGPRAVVLLVDGVSSFSPIPLLRTLPLEGWGLVSSDASPEELVAAISAAARGLIVLPGSLIDHLPLGDAPDVQGAVAEPLTTREKEVLELLSRGLSNKQISRELSISEHTVKFHVSSVLGKLGAESRTEAVGIATRLGLITL